MDATEFRTFGHAMVDRLAEYFAHIEEQPVFPDVEPRFLAQLFDEPLPADPESAEQVLAELDQKLLPYCTHVGHPGYMGLITPSPNPIGVLGDFLCAALNQNLGAYSIGPSAVAMERRVVLWLTDLVGYSPAAGGNLTSGGMLANFIGLKVARDAVSGDRAQLEGIRERWAVYASEERHVSVDEIRALRRIADREGMWLHADAAYGGGMLLSNQQPLRDRGLELADSVTIDPHKWFYAPLDAGAILVKDERRLTASFGMKPSYLTDEMSGANERYQYYVHGFEQSRRFRSLKVWMSFKRYGTRQIGEWIDNNVRQARHLWSLVRQHPEFEAASEPPMSAICMRYRAGNLDQAASKRLHAEVVERVEKSGRFWISTTELKGKTWFRINPVNFRTRTEHIEQLLALLEQECRAATQSATDN